MKSLVFFATSVLLAGTLFAQQDNTKKPPPEFRDVDVPPSVVARVNPEYPAIALKAGMQGTVWVKIWVDSAGAVRDALILKSEADVFNGSALEAARKWKFTPAYIGKRPVDAWVSVPFKFAIAEKVDSLKKAMSATGESWKKSIATISALLEGNPVTWEAVKEIIAPNSTAISGGGIKPLEEVINGQLGGKFTLEDAGRKIVSMTSEDKTDRGVRYYVFQTEPVGKKGTPHYHTVVLRTASDGTPQVIHWHTWQASR